MSTAERPADEPAAPPVAARSPLLMAVFLLLAVAALQYASAFLLPVAVSLLLMFLLGPLVRWMHARGVPESVGAALVVFGAVGVLGAGLFSLAGPAGDWLHDAPATMDKVEQRLRRITRPLSGLQKTAEHLEQATTTPSAGPVRTVQVQSPGALSQLGGTTANAVMATLTVIFLTYFLLASGRMFRVKIRRMAGGTERQERLTDALGEIEGHMSRYLLLNTVISVSVGVLTWALLAAVGLPNAMLWGAVALVLNYVPYIGALVTLLLIVAAALVSFDDTTRLAIAGGGFLLIHLLEGNLLTPFVLGQTMPLNAVAIFTCLLFWGWVWGVPGAIIAVPLTVMIQVICAHTERWKRVAILLDN